MRPYLVAVAGGRGSGTRPFADALADAFGGAPILHGEDYYRAREELALPEREKLNYDHPGVLDTPLLIAHLRALRWGNPVDTPVFDHIRMNRTQESRRVSPAPLVLAEGHLLLCDKELADQFDLRLFLDTPADVRLVRLLLSAEERRESLYTALERYMATVRPTYARYIEPSQAAADIRLPEDGNTRAGIAQVAARIREAIAAR